MEQRKRQEEERINEKIKAALEEDRKKRSEDEDDRVSKAIEKSLNKYRDEQNCIIS